MCFCFFFVIFFSSTAISPRIELYMCIGLVRPWSMIFRFIATDGPFIRSGGAQRGAFIAILASAIKIFASTGRPFHDNCFAESPSTKVVDACACVRVCGEKSRIKRFEKCASEVNLKSIEVCCSARLVVSPNAVSSTRPRRFRCIRENAFENKQ